MKFDLILSVHIPKTGGTSFSRLLERRFGDQLRLDYPWDPLELDDSLSGCIHGHFSVEKYSDLIRKRNGKVALITWVRDPVARAVSTYDFLRHLDSNPPELQYEWERDAKTLGIEEFFRRGHCWNEMSRQLAGCGLKTFSFVGITEFYDESLSRLSSVLGLDLDLKSVPRELESPRPRREKYVEDPNYDKTVHFLERRNREDRRLYDRAVSLFMSHYWDRRKNTLSI